MGTDKPIERLCFALLAVIMVHAAAACASRTELTLVNRSDLPVSLAPGFVVAPCSIASYGPTEIEAIKRSLRDWALALSPDWPPPGVGRVDAWEVWPGRHSFLVISSAEGPRVMLDEAPADGWPLCGGSPQGVTVGDGQ